MADPSASRLGGPHLALLAVQLAFSSLHLIGKVVLETLPPLALASCRVLLATPLFLAVALLKDRRLPAAKWLPKLALLGLLGVFLNQILFVIGLRYTTATNAAILMPSVPVFAVGIGWLSGIERANRRSVLGVGLAVAGSLVLLDPTRFALADASFIGTLLILLNCLCYATFLVVQRPLLFHLPWRTVIAWTFLFGGLGVLAVGGPVLSRVEFSSLPPSIWFGVLYIGVVSTFLGYLLNTWAVRRSSATLAAGYITMQPLLTGGLALLWLREQPSWNQLIGFALIAGGLWLVSWQRGRTV